MRKKSIFSQIVIMIIISVICVILTVGIALFAGSSDSSFLDFKNMNYANMIPILIAGGFISCVIVGIIVLFVARSVFFKVKDYFYEDNKGGNLK